MGGKTKLNDATYELRSPGDVFLLRTGVTDATIWYELIRGDNVLVTQSTVAIYDDNDINLISATKQPTYNQTSHDETWEQPWGEQQFVRNNYQELAIIADTATIRFRLFDDGLGFRYELSGKDDIVIGREETEFNIDRESKAWWIPALGQNHYEHLYRRTTLSDIGIAHTPLTIELPDSTYLAIHEAALYDYGAMNLVPTESGLKSSITPLLDGSAARVALPFHSPWRTVIFSETPYGLGSSKIMLNLNDPSKIPDTSWIRPMKFMGIWWGMFIGYMTWYYGDKHGATTTNALRYINAAKKLGITGLLIEGWNETWEGDWTKNGDRMNHLRPYPDFDIHAVTSYAKQQGIEIVGHHETSGNISHYEWELPEAYDYYGVYGIRYVKTGYVSPRLNTGDFHSSQVGVNHYQRTVEMTAERNMMIDIHEPVKGTGIERTWPNLLAREGVMGQEFEGGTITPEHTTVLPYTRCLAGPLDYTPGIFNLSGTDKKVSSTLAKQLALYVTMYSPMMMVADIPEHYFDQPAFQFIHDVPVNWEATVPLDGVIGEYFITARKDRDSDDWYVGGVTDEQEREITIDFGFLPEHQKYTATLYRDAADAHWQYNPEAHQIETQDVSHDSSVSIRLAPGGGFAIKIAPENETAYPYPDIS